MDVEQIELLPCPFCGGVAKEMPCAFREQAEVQCQNCFAEALRTHWNTRVALTPPEGYVLVPVEITEAMQRAGAGIVCTDVEEIRQTWAAILAARPEVKP